MNRSPQITTTEWRWAISWSLIILLLSCIPYFVVIPAAPEGWQFAGILANPLDGHSYLAKIEQGLDGEWLFHMTYTPEPHDGALIFTFYLTLGHLAGLLGISNVFIFHLARLLTSFLLLLIAFRFIARVTADHTERRLSFLLLITASGLGWLGVIFGAFPIDLWIPEAFVPYTLYTNPHFPLGMALMIIIFEQVVWTPQPHHLAAPILRAGLAALVLAIILPFALLSVWTALIAFIGWQYFSVAGRLPWLHIWPTLGTVLFASPLIAYLYWISVTNPILAGWSAQNITAAPSFLNFVLGYGLLSLLAVAGIGLIVRQEINSQRGIQKQSQAGIGQGLVVWWAVTTIILVYVPFELQRRLITGLHIPVSILAAIGLHRGLRTMNLNAGHQRMVTLGVIMIGAFGTLFVWGLYLFGAMQSPTSSATTALLFMRQDEVAAFEWLRTQVEPDDIILASPRIGMFIPGQTGARSYYGHPFETIEAETKQAQVKAFFAGNIEMVSPTVDFILYGPSEWTLGQPQTLSAYPVVFSIGDVKIYQISE